MAFKYYSALQATDGDQTLPLPMTLHNNNAATVNLEITPEGAGLIFQPFAVSAALINSVVKIPTLKAAQAATTYTTTTISGQGSGATVSAASNDAGELTSFPGTGATQGALVKTLFTYTPGTTQQGTGFELTFAITQTNPLVFENVVIDNSGAGYEAGDQLIFNQNGLSMLMLISADMIAPVQLENVTILTAGDNYLAGDTIEFVMTETVATVVYTYPVRVLIQTANLLSSYITYSLLAGETSPMRASVFKVLGTDNRSILGNSN